MRGGTLCGLAYPGRGLTIFQHKNIDKTFTLLYNLSVRPTKFSTGEVDANVQKSAVASQRHLNGCRALRMETPAQYGKLEIAQCSDICTLRIVSAGNHRDNS